MDFLHRLESNPVKLFILSQTLLLLAFVFRDFPIFIFFAFAPLFALIDHPSALKYSYLPFIAAIGTAFIFYYTMRESMQQSSVLSWIIYFTLLATVFTSYILLQQWTHDALNRFSLIIFILSMEYFFLKFAGEFTPVFLADLLRHKTTWTRWNVFTGYTGSTLWILVANLVFYHALLARGKINWFLFIFAFLIVLLPIAYSFSVAYDSITKVEVINLYSHNSSDNSLYYDRGELISRTGAWVSALIIIFTVIKGMTKRVSR